MDSLAQRLKEARGEAGISQAVLAKKSGCGQSTIASIESGRNQGSTLISVIAQVLGVQPLWLSTGKGCKVTSLPPERVLSALPEHIALIVQRLMELGDEHPAVIAINALLAGYETAEKGSPRKKSQSCHG